MKKSDEGTGWGGETLQSGWKIRIIRRKTQVKRKTGREAFAVLRRNKLPLSELIIILNES